jgi:membrane protease subunit (stomatin/prohibitin family)
VLRIWRCSSSDYINNWDKLFESPFKSDVYFFSTRLHLDQKWGTPNPISIRDREFGATRLRAFGVYNFRIVDPKAFHLHVSGTCERYTVSDLAGQLRSTIVGAITDLFAESAVPFLDLAANQDELAVALRAKLAPSFQSLGLELAGFVIENLSLPEALQQVLDQRIGASMAGDLDRYTKFQVASHVGTAASNEGGLAGIGAGLATALVMGNTMTEALGDPARSARAERDVIQLLERLHDLKQKGVVTEDEFKAKKAELLGNL